MPCTSAKLPQPGVPQRVFSPLQACARQFGPPQELHRISQDRLVNLVTTTLLMTLGILTSSPCLLVSISDRLIIGILNIQLRIRHRHWYDDGTIVERVQ